MVVYLCVVWCVFLVMCYDCYFVRCGVGLW